MCAIIVKSLFLCQTIYVLGLLKATIVFTSLFCCVHQAGELQHLDQQVREQINLANQWAEKLVAGKVSKQQYLDTEATIRAKNAGLLQKAEDILASF